MADIGELKLAAGVAKAYVHEERLEDLPEDAAQFWAAAGPKVEFEDSNYPGAAGQQQRLRIYRGGGASSPSLLYIHGGGWVKGSIELNDYSARLLAALGELNVVGISYRLAPTSPFPSCLEDCKAALHWLSGNGSRLGLNGAVAIGGASAGANLAFATALAEQGSGIAGMLLFYGVFGADFETESYRCYADGPGLTRAEMREYFDAYDPENSRAGEPLITPLLAQDLSFMPPAHVVIAEHDVLRDDSIALAAALRSAGVGVSEDLVAGVLHGFINRGRLVPAADQALKRGADFVAGLGPQASKGSGKD